MNCSALQKDGNIIVVGAGSFDAARVKGDPPITVSIRKNISVTEGNTGFTPATFQVVLNRISNLPVKVKVKTIDGTAIKGSDYNANSGTLTIKPGKLSVPVTVNIIADNIKEPNETFSLVLAQPVNAILGDLDTAICLIKNDDVAFAENTFSKDDLQTNNSKIKLYPNPAKEILYIEGLNTNIKTNITVVDVNGNTLIRKIINNKSCSINIRQIVAGTYYVKIGNGIKTITLKFIKE